MTDEEIIERICNAADHQRIISLEAALKLTAPNNPTYQPLNDYIKTVAINLDFILEFQVGPLHYLEELDLSSNVQQAAWDEFSFRCRTILEILSSLPNLTRIKLFVDVDLTTRTLVQQLEVYNVVCKILQHPILSCKNPRFFTLELSFGGRSDLSGDLGYLWATFEQIGKFIRKFKIKQHAGLWLPSRLLHLFKIIGPLTSVHLCDGARITPQLIEEIARGSAHTLQSLQIPSPDYVDDESLVTVLLSKCARLRKLGIDGAISTWSRVQSGGFYNQLKCSKLENIDISRCQKLPHQFYKSISMDAHQIGSRIVTLRAISSNISDTTLALVISHSKFLRLLDIGFCEGVTDAVLKLLAKTGHGMIHEINIVGCRNVYNSTPITSIDETISTEICQQPHFIALLSESCPNLARVRIGPIQSTRQDMLPWRLLGTCQIALAAFKNGDGWDGSILPDRCYVLESQWVREMKRILVEQADRVDLLGMRPFYGVFVGR